MAEVRFSSLKKVCEIVVRQCQRNCDRVITSFSPPPPNEFSHLFGARANKKVVFAEIMKGIFRAQANNKQCAAQIFASIFHYFLTYNGGGLHTP